MDDGHIYVKKITSGFFLLKPQVPRQTKCEKISTRFTFFASLFALRDIKMTFFQLFALLEEQ